MKSILLNSIQNQCTSQITTTQASASPGDGSMGATDPDYVGIGMGPRARLGFVRKFKVIQENVKFILDFEHFLHLPIHPGDTSDVP